MYELQAAVCTLSKLRFAAGDMSLDKHLEEMMVSHTSLKIVY